MADLPSMLNQLRQRAVDLVCLDQPIDTTTAMGKMLFTILAAFGRDTKIQIYFSYTHIGHVP